MCKLKEYQNSYRATHMLYCLIYKHYNIIIMLYVVKFFFNAINSTWNSYLFQVLLMVQIILSKGPLLVLPHQPTISAKPK